jgi:hypothetical protein
MHAAASRTLSSNSAGARLACKHDMYVCLLAVSVSPCVEARTFSSRSNHSGHAHKNGH